MGRLALKNRANDSRSDQKSARIVSAVGSAADWLIISRQNRICSVCPKAMNAAVPTNVAESEAQEKEWAIIRNEADQAQAWLENHREQLSDADLDDLLGRLFPDTAP